MYLCATKLHAWMVINEYKILISQYYLESGWSPLQKRFTRAQFGVLPGLAHIMPWLQQTTSMFCRLCKLGEENITHLICICPPYWILDGGHLEYPLISVHSFMQTSCDCML